MISFDAVTIRYPDAAAPALTDVSFTVDEGEMLLVCGETGSGKTTLLRAVNGLVPYFSGGTVHGSISVDGRDTATHQPREMADLVGFVTQDPLAGFVADTVEEELAYGMEQLGIAPVTMRARVEQTMDLLGIADLRQSHLRTLSGGQQQRVAIGAALAAGCRVLVLDEPTSSLDPTSAEEVLAALLRLVHDSATTVMIAEHRMERAAQYADRVAYLDGSGSVQVGEPATILAAARISPPVVQLAKVAGWESVPLTIRDARRVARPLRQQLAGVDADGVRDAGTDADGVRDAGVDGVRDAAIQESRHTTGETRPAAATGVVVRYGNTIAVRDVSLTLQPGQITALMGRNGSGKSSLLWALTGLGPRDAGELDLPGRVALVPQTPSDLLYLDSVAAECASADRAADQQPGACAALVERIAGPIDPAAHPRDLSEGQRLGLVLGAMLLATPDVILLDEPTRGLDYGAKERLGQVLEELAAAGRNVLLATHDVEFVARVASRVVMMAAGEIVADGSAADILTDIATFAPQVAKILAPGRWLTVDHVRAGLAHVAQVPAREGEHVAPRAPAPEEAHVTPVGGDGV